MSDFSATLTPISTIDLESPSPFDIEFSPFQDVTIDDKGDGVFSINLSLRYEANSVSSPPPGSLFINPLALGGWLGVLDGRIYGLIKGISDGNFIGGDFQDAVTKETVGSFIFENGLLVFSAETTVSAKFAEDFLEYLHIGFFNIDYAFTFSGIIAGPSFAAFLDFTNDAPELDASVSGDVFRTGVATMAFETAELIDNSGTLLKQLNITSDVAGDTFTLPDSFAWRGGVLELDGTTLRNAATGVAFFEVSGLGTNSITVTSLYDFTELNLTAGQAIRMVPEQDAGSAVLEALMLNPVSAGDRSLTVTATDFLDDVGVFDFTVTATSNFAPTLTGLPAELFGLTQVTAPLDLAAIDIEGDSATEILTLTLTPDLGVASATSGGGVTVVTGGTVLSTSVALTGTADALDAFLDAGGVSFRPFPSTGTDLGSIDVTLSDGVFTVDAGTIAITASDTPPAFSGPVNFQVREGGRTVADLTSVDNQDSEGAGISYSINPTVGDAVAFAIDPATGVLSFRNAPDFEAPGSGVGTNLYLISIRVTDSSGLFAERFYSVTVTDDPAPVAEDDAIALSKSETREINVLENDSDGEGPVTFASLDLTGTQGGVTDLGNGLLRYDPGAAFAGLADGATATDSFAYTIRDSNGETATAVVEVTISGSPPNLPPSLALTPLTLALPEDTDLSTRLKVADVVITDDGIGTNTLSLGGADAGVFELDGVELFLRAGTALDFETDPGLAVTVSVDDPDIGPGPEASAELTLAVTDVNEAPDLSLENVLGTLSEATDTSTRIKIADIVVTDDALGTNTLALTGANAGLFEIAGSELFLAAGSVLDFETNPQLDVTVTLDDTAFTGLEGSVGVLLAITDVNEPPQLSLVNLVSRLAEDADTSVRIRVADIRVTDDALGTNTLIRSGRDVALFEIVGSQLFLRAGTTLDSAVLAQLQVSVLIDDVTIGTTADDTVSLSVSITEVNTPPVVEDDPVTDPIPVPEDDTVTNAPPVALDDMLSSSAFAPVFAFDPTANDTDLDGDPLSLGALSANGSGFSFATPTGTGLLTDAGGIVLQNDDGSLSYAAPMTFTGLDSFTYAVEDTSGATDTGTVTVQVLNSGLSPSELQARTIAYLHEAAFDRLPDLPGLNFWIDVLFSELPEQSRAFTVVDIAEFFLASEEFEGRIGGALDTLTDQAFVELIYRNVLDRDGDADGIAFWVDALGTPEFGRDDVLVAFAVSPENQLGAPEIIGLIETSPGEWGFI